jgi:hypothetical protein
MIYFILGILTGSIASYGIIYAWAERQVRIATLLADRADVTLHNSKQLNRRADACQTGHMNTFDAIMDCEPLQDTDMVEIEMRGTINGG